MKEILVAVLWQNSSSSDVVEQDLSWTVNNGDPQNVSLDPIVARYELGWLPENAVVAASLIAVDGSGNQSDAATLAFTLPDLSKPLAPTGFSYEILDTRDVVVE